jgi:hypothetical protein
MQRRVGANRRPDAVLFVVNAELGVGPGGWFIPGAAQRQRGDVCAVSKVDRLNNAETAAVLAGPRSSMVDDLPGQRAEGTRPRPITSRGAPRRAVSVPAGQRSDLPSEVLLAGIREQVLVARDGPPPSGQVSGVAHREDGVVEVHATSGRKPSPRRGS